MTVGELKKYLKVVNDEIEIFIKQNREDPYDSSQIYVAEIPIISVEMSDKSFCLWGEKE